MLKHATGGRQLGVGGRRCIASVSRGPTLKASLCSRKQLQHTPPTPILKRSSRLAARSPARAASSPPLYSAMVRSRASPTTWGCSSLPSARATAAAMRTSTHGSRCGSGSTDEAASSTGWARRPSLLSHALLGGPFGPGQGELEGLQDPLGGCNKRQPKAAALGGTQSQHAPEAQPSTES